MEYAMRNLHAAAIGLAVFLAGPTLAQAASESAKMSGQDQTQNQTQSEPGKMNAQGQNGNQSIRQQVKNNLEQAGFSDIKIIPQSFLVRAKDAATL
jgi:osmotically-inducible protein OsmY